MNYSQLSKIIEDEDWEAIESARGSAIKEHVGPLVELYRSLSRWPQKIAIIQLLQDQQVTPAVVEVMNDVLRAPNVNSWFQDTVELTKAVALGFVDSEHDGFMAFYNDRDLLRRTVDSVLKAKGLEVEPAEEAPLLEVNYPSATSIFEAIDYGQSIDGFIEEGADLDQAGQAGEYVGWTPLTYALKKQQFGVAEALVSAGASPDLARPVGEQTPLMWAAMYGQREIAARLMDKGADMNRVDQWGDSVVKIAAQYGYLDMMNDAIERGADFQVAYRDGRTAIWFAAEAAKVEAVLRLVEAGVDINGLGSGSAPLHVAVRHKHIKLVIALLENGADPNLPNGSGRTPLMLAAATGNIKLIQALLKGGADPGLKDSQGRSAADFASGKRADAVKQALASS